MLVRLVRTAMSVFFISVYFSFPQPTAKQLYEEALKGGYVLCRIALCILIGAAGGGKTQTKYLLLNSDPPPERDSTDLSEPPVRAVSLDRATTTMSGWKVVTPDEFLSKVLGSMKANKYRSDLPSPSTAGTVPPTPSTTSTLPPSTSTTSTRQPKASATASDSTPSQPSATARGKPVSDRSSGSVYEETLATLEKEVKEKLAHTDHVLDVNWVYLLDTGGQPQFQEILPAFIKRALAIFFVTKLNEKFSDCPTAEYWKKGKKIGEQTSSVSNEKFLKRYFRVMQSRCSQTDHGEGPFVFFIGTHKDRVDPDKLDETCTDKNSKLHEMLGDHFQDKLKYHDLSSKDLIYPVNATSRDKVDVDVASKIRGDLHQELENITPERIPYTWFLFEHYIQQLAAEKNLKVLSIEECQWIGGTKLGMSNERCHAALKYLTGLNILFYNPKRGVVFVNSQVLVGMVSLLVRISYALSGGGHNDFIKELGLSKGGWRTFGTYGLLTVDLLKSLEDKKELKGHYRDDIFTPEDFLELLKELQLVALSEKDSQSSKSAKFFMPCVLRELPQDEIPQHRPKSPTASPLLIYYPDMQLLPAGIFIILIACLQNKHGWTVRRTKSKEPELLCRNCVKFDLPIKRRGSVTLIDSFAGYLEIHVQSPSRDRSDVCHEACPKIVQGIYMGLSDAARVLGYGELKHELGIFCDGGGGPACKEELHLAEIIDDEWQCRDDPDWGDSLRQEHKYWLTGMYRHTCSLS